MNRTAFLLLFCVVATTGCAKSEASIDSSMSRAFSASRLQSLAIMPVPELEGASVDDLALSVGRRLAVDWQGISFVGPSDSRGRIEGKGLTSDWIALTEYVALESNADTVLVRRLGESLNVDAMLQGVVYDIDLRQHAAFGNRGKIELTVRFVLLSTETGETLWEARSRAVKEAETTFANPDVDEALELALNRILENLPSLE